MTNAILKLDSWICKSLSAMAVGLLCLLFFLMSLNVIARFAPVFSMGWFDEIVELSFAWTIFATAAVLWRKKAHPSIDILEMMLDGRRAKYLVLIFIEVVNIIFLAAFTYYGYSLVEKAAAASPIFQIPRKVFYVVLPVTGAYMTTVSLFFLCDHVRKLLAPPAPGDAT
ncbi:TRAP-type C4-dicarboxylate transport system permease small subunit [Aliiruegeria haliotis]|uniref:TRAP transporter small permease protein n=1 Tax=Aliiruegeria haliotis TaxID=1280846 RepID=A0A2T0RHM7_9RHOB|nr:TRAP transporter small permease subunit [Aliiruegeria haliotis]PRY20632.1 TRAP-type C4-dicarboxylate transport system permease small subunit [Aliiruegeria haliotis]